jgi:hypothetical protein
MVFYFTTQHYEGVYNITRQGGGVIGQALYENSHRWLCTILWDSAFQHQTKG